MPLTFFVEEKRVPGGGDMYPVPFQDNAYSPSMSNRQKVNPHPWEELGSRWYTVPRLGDFYRRLRGISPQNLGPRKTPFRRGLYGFHICF